ncbi:hypothetical protein HGRIS_006398 [Hohenbuehelia grisea]|uniref:Uncharacterized protein n=1 Tax=Hohenbuehelia grisea TaxID=104357 RepID=A0ABR3K2Q4_9AGAR
MLSNIIVHLGLCVALALSAASTPAGSSLTKRHVLTCLDPTNAPIIQQGYLDAKAMSAFSTAYISARGTSDPLFTQYFKTNTATAVQAVFNAIALDNSVQGLGCPASCPSGSGVAVTDAAGDIDFCPSFYTFASTNAICTSSSSTLPLVRAGQVIAQLSKVLSNVGSKAGSCGDSAALSAADSLQNRASFSCFAVSVYKATQC